MLFLFLVVSVFLLWKMTWLALKLCGAILGGVLGLVGFLALGLVTAIGLGAGLLFLPLIFLFGLGFVTALIVKSARA